MAVGKKGLDPPEETPAAEKEEKTLVFGVVEPEEEAELKKDWIPGKDVVLCDCGIPERRKEESETKGAISNGISGCCGCSSVEDDEAIERGGARSWSARIDNARRKRTRLGR